MTKIRSLTVGDFEQWLEVYRFYGEHYDVSLTTSGIDTTWNWLMDPEQALNGLVAEVGGNLVGLAHYRAMPSPLRGKYIGFLDDIIVTPRERGSKAATLLLAELKTIGHKQGWDIIRWITKDNNYRARSLYDKFAIKTDWNMYEMELHN